MKDPLYKVIKNKEKLKEGVHSWDIIVIETGVVAYLGLEQFEAYKTCAALNKYTGE